MYTVCLHYKSKRSGGLLARVDLRTGEVPRGVLIRGISGSGGVVSDSLSEVASGYVWKHSVLIEQFFSTLM